MKLDCCCPDAYHCLHSSRLSQSTGICLMEQTVLAFFSFPFLLDGTDTFTFSLFFIFVGWRQHFCFFTFSVLLGGTDTFSFFLLFFCFGGEETFCFTFFFHLCLVENESIPFPPFSHFHFSWQNRCFLLCLLFSFFGLVENFFFCLIQLFLFSLSSCCIIYSQIRCISDHISVKTSRFYWVITYPQKQIVPQIYRMTTGSYSLTSLCQSISKRNCQKTSERVATEERMAVSICLVQVKQ